MSAYCMSRRRLRIRTFFFGFVLIAEGLATVLMLGKNPWWSFKFIAWDTKRWLKNRRNYENETEGAP